MRPLDDWADEHWDILAMAAAFLLAVALSVSLSVAYNMAAAHWDPLVPATPAVEVGSPASEPAPLPLFVPYT